MPFSMRKKENPAQVGQVGRGGRKPCHGSAVVSPEDAAQRAPLRGGRAGREGTQGVWRPRGVVSKKARPAVVSEHHKLTSSLGNVYPHCFPECANGFPSSQFKIASRNANEGLSAIEEVFPLCRAPFLPCNAAFIYLHVAR